MSFLGSGYPLFFIFLQFSIFFFLIFFVTTGIYGFVKNSIGKNCLALINDLSEPCQINEITKYSYFNNLEKEHDVVLNGLNLAVTLFLIILTNFFRKFHIINETELDNSLLSPSDYSCLVTNLPKNQTEEDIKKFFCNYTHVYDIQIARINKTYKIGDFIRLQREFLSSKKRNSQEIKVLEKNILKLEDEISNNLEVKFSSVAIITFNRQSGKEFFCFFIICKRNKPIQHFTP